MSIALVIARAMQLETLRDPFDVQFGGEAIPRGPGAATSLLLDLLSCVPAILVLARRALNRNFTTRTTLAHVLFGLLGIWTAASTFWAADQFAAAVARRTSSARRRCYGRSRSSFAGGGSFDSSRAYASGCCSSTSRTG
jgi:hypothetical protein